MALCCHFTSFWVRDWTEWEWTLFQHVEHWVVSWWKTSWWQCSLGLDSVLGVRIPNISPLHHIFFPPGLHISLFLLLKLSIIVAFVLCGRMCCIYTRLPCSTAAAPCGKTSGRLSLLTRMFLTPSIKRTHLLTPFIHWSQFCPENAGPPTGERGTEDFRVMILQASRSRGLLELSFVNETWKKVL